MTPLFTSMSPNPREVIFTGTPWLEQIHLQVSGNLMTVAIIGLLYLNYILFEPYIGSISFAILVSVALRSTKDSIISSINVLKAEPSGQSPTPIARQPRKSVISALFTQISDLWNETPISFIPLRYGGPAVALGLISIMCVLGTPWDILAVVAVVLTPILLFIVWILDRKVFAYDRICNDHTMVAILLLSFLFFAGSLIIAFFSVECIKEASMATSRVAGWTQRFLESVTSDDSFVQQYVNDGKALISSYVAKDGRIQIEPLLTRIGLNGTQWGPIATAAIKVVESMRQNSSFSFDPQSLGSPEAGVLVVNTSASEMGLWETARHNFNSLQDNWQHFSWDSLTDVATKSRHVLEGVGYSLLLPLFSGLIVALTSSIDYCIRFLVTATCLFYLLRAEKDVFSLLIDLLPAQHDVKEKAVAKLRVVVSEIFFLPINIALYHAGLTLVIFVVSGAEYYNFASLLSFVFSAVPVIPAGVVSLPWFLAYLFKGHIVWSICFFGLHFYLSTVLASQLYDTQIEIAPPYITGLSVAMGLSVFGLKGILLGPLLVCSMLLAYQAVRYASNGGRETDMGMTPQRPSASVPPLAPPSTPAAAAAAAAFPMMPHLPPPQTPAPRQKERLKLVPKTPAPFSRKDIS